MQSINLPFKDRNFKIINKDEKILIWDIVRKKYIINTPEEWVRQHILHLLIDDYLYPISLIAVEKWIQLDKVKKRFDIVIYDTFHRPFMLIECKQPNVQITDTTVFQILNYQRKIQAPYILISNGKVTFLGTIENNNILWIDEIPKIT